MRQRRRIDHASHTPLYHQLADILREAIQAGEYEPGALLPTEIALQQEHELSRDTVRDAMAVLQREGLIVTRHGHGSRVAEQPEPRVIPVGPGRRIWTRQPTERERREMQLPVGTPVIVISRPGQEDEVLPGGRETILSTQADEPAAVQEAEPENGPKAGQDEAPS